MEIKPIFTVKLPDMEYSQYREVANGLQAKLGNEYHVIAFMAECEEPEFQLFSVKDIKECDVKELNLLVLREIKELKAKKK